MGQLIFIRSDGYINNDKIIKTSSIKVSEFEGNLCRITLPNEIESIDLRAMCDTCKEDVYFWNLKKQHEWLYCNAKCKNNKTQIVLNHIRYNKLNLQNSLPVERQSG